MPKSLGGAQRIFRIWQQVDDLLQCATGGLPVLAKSQMPIRQRIEREGNVLRSMAGLSHKMLNGIFCARQVSEVFGENSRQQQVPLQIGRKPFELSPNLGHSF